VDCVHRGGEDRKGAKNANKKREGVPENEAKPRKRTSAESGRRGIEWLSRREAKGITGAMVTSKERGLGYTGGDQGSAVL